MLHVVSIWHIQDLQERLPKSNFDRAKFQMMYNNCILIYPFYRKEP